MEDPQFNSPQVPESRPSFESKSEEPMLASAETGHAKPGVHLSSKKRWFKIGIAVALLNPVISGLILGIFFWREPEMQREGKIITTISVVWGVIVLVLTFAGRAKGWTF